MEQIGIIVGLGSVGKLHAKALDKFCEVIYIVDPNKEVLSWAELNLSSAVVYIKNLSSLKRVTLFNPLTIAVVSNWGPQHFETIKLLIHLGIKKIICEKPFTNNLWKANRIEKIAKKHNVKLLVGITRRHTDFAKKIQEIFKEYCGPEIRTISVMGGGQCLVTSGVHWIDLAFQLFEGSPSNVIGKIREQRINPRSTHLGYFDGFASWDFKNNRFLTLLYNNDSNLRTKIYIYGKRGYLEIDPSLNIQIYEIELSSRTEALKITETRSPSLVRTIPITEIQHHDPFSNQIEILLTNKDVKYTFKDSQEVLNALIGSLISSRKGKFINLPIKKSSYLFFKDWNIS